MSSLACVQQLSGHMCVHKLDPFQISELANVIPHHAVLKDARSTTKVTCIFALPGFEEFTLDEVHTFSRAAQVLLRDVFIGGPVTGADSAEEALQLKLEIVSLLE
ncbi:hypothetical protein PR048_011267 [Dryococelus australis]|uniref:Uncharacterized protein n=1 Tax=Dryococelus australis TaxID=614101 RepID=A0ABQ9HL50_9NEOP|nr:hypothetical protein PR048_011267 [Dryococelus australis]